MIKKLKATNFVVYSLFLLCVFFLINPQVCSSACLSGVTVWARSVFPVLFPFFILTRMIVSYSNDKKTFLDKYFSKFYHAPNGSFQIFLLSLLSGYPMGAKLICSYYDDGKINSYEAEKMMSFCSMAGPMFIIGTVGLSIMHNKTCGYIILLANILATLSNGIIFSKLSSKNKKTNILKFETNHKAANISIADIVYDSLISILMVGSYIAIAFIMIEVLKISKILEIISLSLSNLIKVDQGVIYATLIGFFEITKGSIELSSLSLSTSLKTTIISGIIGFGGISVMMQNLSFLKKLRIPIKSIFKQKIVQGFLSTIFAFIITFIIKC